MKLKKREKYNILLLGWYGYNAIGDDIIGDVIKEIFNEEAQKRGILLNFSSYSIISSYPRRLYNSFCVKYDLIIIGGGSIIGVDTMSLYLSIFGSNLINRLRISNNIDTPIVIFGPGFRKEGDRISEKDQKNMKQIFDRASLTGVRGPISQKLLIENDIVDQVEIIGDPALSFSPIPINEPISEKTIGINARYIKSSEPQYLNNNEISKIFAQLADHFINEGYTVSFFSFTENNHDSDLYAANNIQKLMKNKKKSNIIIPNLNLDIKYICSIIGKFEDLVSQRLHPSILGWVQNIPNISFEYQFLKTTDFIQSIEMQEYLIKTDEFTFDLFLDKYSKLQKERDEIKKKSLEKINFYRMKQRKFVNSCLDIIENR